MELRTLATAVLALGGLTLASCEPATSPLGDEGASSGSGGNRPPVIHSLTIDPPLVPRGGKATVMVVASDPDGDGVTFEFSAEHGTIARHATILGRADYQHDGSATATDSIRVKVTDASGASATQAHACSVSGPLAVDVTPATASCHPKDSSTACTVRCTANAAGGSGSYSYTWSGCASGGGASADCKVTSLSKHICSVKVQDGAGATADGSASVTGINSSPSCQTSGPTIVPAKLPPAVAGSRSYSTSDTDGDEPKCTGLTQPPYISFEFVKCASGYVYYMANCNSAYQGAHGTLAVHIEDGWGASAVCNYAVQCP